MTSGATATMGRCLAFDLCRAMLLFQLWAAGVSETQMNVKRVLSIQPVQTEPLVNCPLFWSEFRGCCYRYFPVNKTWVEAELHCAQFSNGVNSAKLVSIHSWEENTFVFDLVNSIVLDFPTGIWIGLHDRRKESNFEWSDGSFYTFSYWDESQPDDEANPGQGEDCVEMGSAASTALRSWNDITCGRSFPFVCKVASLSS